MTIPAILFSDEPDEDRGHERYRIRLGAVRVEVGANVSDLLVHDVSAAGILLETDQKLAIGFRIGVEFPKSLRRKARIVWASNNFYGAEFTEGLSPEELGWIFSASDVVWPNFNRKERSGSSGLRQGLDSLDNAASSAVENDCDDFTLGSEDKLPLSARLKVIFGIATCSWVIIGGGISLALG